MIMSKPKLTLLLFVSLLFSFLAPGVVRKAEAACFCDCGASASAAWTAHTTAVKGMLAAYETLYVALINYHKNEWPGFAGSASKSLAKVGAKETAGSEAAMSTDINNTFMETKIGILSTLAPPTSMVACSIASYGKAADQFEQKIEDNLVVAEDTWSDVLSNAPGTIAEKGRVGYVANRAKNRIDNYGTSGADLKPTAIFKTGGLTSAADVKIAQDFVDNLLGDVVQDPVTKDGLAVPAGRTRMVDNTQSALRTNLARGVFNQLIEQNKDASVLGVTPAVGGTGMSMAELTQKKAGSQMVAKVGTTTSSEGAAQASQTLIALMAEDDRLNLKMYDLITQLSLIEPTIMATLTE